MRLLVLETSSEHAAVAVADGARLLASQPLPAGRRHARDLAPLAAQLVARQGWQPAKLDGVFVDVGPGSYTGLRVAVAFAKTLAFATGVRLVGVDALTICASQAPDAERVWAVADAQQRMQYVACFRVQARVAERLAETAIMPAEAWRQELRPGDVATGPSAGAQAPHLPAGIVLPAEAERFPRVETLLRLGLTAHLAGRHSDPDALLPHYLRPSAAETQWRARAAGVAPR